MPKSKNVVIRVTPKQAERWRRAAALAGAEHYTSWARDQVDAAVRRAQRTAPPGETGNPGPRETGPQNAGPQNAGPQNAGPQNAGPEDGGPREPETYPPETHDPEAKSQQPPPPAGRPEASPSQ